MNDDLPFPVPTPFGIELWPSQQSFLDAMKAIEDDVFTPIEKGDGPSYGINYWLAPEKPNDPQP